MIQAQSLNYLLESGSTTFMDLLKPEYYSEYLAEYEFIKEHYDKFGNIPDQVTFLNKFEDFDIIKVHESPSYLIDQLKRDKNKRDLIDNYNKMKDLIFEDKIEDAVDFMKTSAQELNNFNDVTYVNLLDATKRLDKYLDKCENKSKYFISTGFKELDAALGGWDAQEELAVIVARPNVGKCLEKGTEVLMADGTIKKVEDIIIGDKVQSVSSINTVVALHNGISNGYRITTSRGDSFTVSSNHILTFYKRDEIWDKVNKKVICPGTGKLVDMMVEDYLALSKHQKHLLSLYYAKVDYTSKDLLIDPYILGLWLGDGTSADTGICIMDKEVVQALESYCISNGFLLNIRPSSNTGRSSALVYSIVKGTAKEAFSVLLKKLNLYNNKHIPLDYLTSSTSQRLNLLAGLLDTDGCLVKDHFEFLQKNKTVFDNLIQLTKSLGFKVTLPKPKIINSVKYYRANIYGDLSIIPTHIARKKSTYKSKKRSYTAGFSIKPIDKVEYYGFQCDGDSRYLLSTFILTHNSQFAIKCATAAVEQNLRVGIYSGEMSDDKVGYRVDTMIEHIPNYDLTRGDRKSEIEYKKYVNALPGRYKGGLWCLTPIELGAPATVQDLKNFIIDMNLDILFVDQYSLLEDTHHAKSEPEKFANLSKDLKNLQVLLKKPIIAVSQQHRSSTEEETIIDVGHIAMSDRIGQDATTVLFLTCKDKMLDVYISKSRDAEKDKKLRYAIDWNVGTFQFVPDEIPQEAIEEISLEQTLSNMQEQEGTYF